ncbi:MAG: substrate-binding domain-containing protein [Clostridia bacterium]|nr:substrate-binding domain-containing protein [Clostridia bacterium]
MKKIILLILLLLTVALCLAGCGTDNDTISVISREEGSGTRGAFVEILGIEQKNADGKKLDMTADTAEITDSTSVMITTVAGNNNAIGYISLGTLNDKIKVLEIDGASANAENVKNGSYKVSRPFNIATKGEPKGISADFISFILSSNGQSIVEKSGYISEGNNGEYKASGLSGKITVGGSSSVTPVMEKLKEEYIRLNPNITVDIQQSDSTMGLNSTAEGIYDIGMASRELKESETTSGLISTAIALDGIAVIVNKENPVSGLTAKQIMQIYTGEITSWSEISK